MREVDTQKLSKQRVGRRTVLRTAVLGGAGLATAALLGCGGGDEKKTATQTSSNAGTGATQVAANDPRYPRDPTLPYPYNFPEPNKQPKPGGTLTVAATWDVSTWDPTKSAAGGTITVPNLIYNRLIGIKGGPDMNPLKIETVPELAQSWERTPDGLVFTFKLQPGVKWQNVAPLHGRAFVAQDVVFAGQRYQKEGVHQSYWTQVDKLEAPDQGTVKVTLKAPTPEWEIPLGSRYQTIFPRELVDSGEIEKKAIGTGPLILKEAIQSQHVALTANPDYWRRKVLLDGAEFRMMPDASARVAAFRAKQIDYGYAVASTKRDIDELQKTIPDLQVNSIASVNQITPFSINVSSPKFQDERVRRALSLALDRKSLLSLVYQGLGKEALPVLPWTYIFDKEPTDFGPWVKFDLAQAKQLLQAAGAPDLSFNDTYYPYTTTSDQLAEVTLNQLRAAGVSMKTDKADYTTFNSQWIGAKLPEASVTGYAAIGFDANTWFYNQIYSKSPGNRWQIKDAQLDQWAQQQAVELDPQKRKELQRKIWDRDLDMMFRIPMPLGATYEVYQPWLRGIRFGQILTSTSSYYDWGMQIENAWLDK